MKLRVTISDNAMVTIAKIVVVLISAIVVIAKLFIG